jgi:hypothetical protein
LILRKIFASFDQRNFMSRIVTLANCHFKLFGEFGRGLVFATRRLRINSSNSSSGNRRRNFFLDFSNII